MKKIAITLATLGFILFTGCGGEDDAPPPMPPGQSDSTKQGFNDLASQAKNFKAACGASAGPAFLGAAAALQQPGGQGGQGGQGGAPAMPPPSSDCGDSFSNLL